MRIADIWPAVLGISAFFGGVTFFALILVLERSRRLHEVALPRAAVWGALSGPVMVAFAIAGWFSVWMSKQVAAAAGTPSEIARR